MTTLAPTDCRAPWTAPSGRDAAYAAGYSAGLGDGRQRRDRLVVAGLVVGLIVGGRRLRVHWLLLSVGMLLLVPMLATGLVVELLIRHHRRHGSWPRTLAYGASWLLGIGLVVLAAAGWSAWPLAGVVVLVAAWTVGPRAFGAYRRHRSRAPR